jgi:hypothetical protein
MGQFPAQGQDPSTSGQVPEQGHNGTGTGQFPTPGYQNHQDPSTTGQFPAQGQDPSTTGQFPAQGHNGSGTGQFPTPGYPNHQDPSTTGQFEQPQADGGFGASRPQAPQQQAPQQQAPQQQPPRRQDPEALPPAPSPGDGRTPLFDTLETNWFHGDRQQNGGSAPQEPQQPQPQQEPAAPERPATPAWRTSPNDELVRQAERVRQPAAGGVTTSGLPRRVPRANLVPGTAQQQQNHTGPQVSRAPDEVRGRLTNLRRGIAQGRQAGTGQTGNHPSPTHQQEQ